MLYQLSYRGMGNEIMPWARLRKDYSRPATGLKWFATDLNRGGFPQVWMGIHLRRRVSHGQSIFGGFATAGV